MNTLPSRSLPWPLLLLAGVACSGGDRVGGNRQVSRGSPQLTPIDSIVLEETDSSFVGRPSAFPAVDNAGQVYLADELSDRLFRFAPDGRLSGIIGRKGQGPGEFEGIGPFPVASLDTIVVVPAFGTARLSVFHSVSGTYLFGLRFAGHVTKAEFSRDRRLLLATPSGTTGRAVISVPRDSLEGLARSGNALLQPTLVALPKEYETYPYLRTYLETFFATAGDTMLVAYGGLNFVTRTIGGSAADTFEVPATKRRGVPPAVLADMRPGRLSEVEAAQRISTVLGVWALPGGGWLVWHQDPSLETKGGSITGLIGRAYLSVLRADLTAACVDTEVPAPGTNRPRIFSRGDTVYSIDQVISPQPTPAGAERAVTVVRRYRLSTDGCDWLPMPRRG